MALVIESVIFVLFHEIILILFLLPHAKLCVANVKQRRANGFQTRGAKADMAWIDIQSFQLALGLDVCVKS